MPKHLAKVLAVAGLVAIPAMAQAQAHAMASGGPEHEFGVDMNLVYSHIGSVGGVSCSTNCSQILIGTPVDVRVGFMGHGSMMWEPRVTLGFVSQGGTFIAFDPGLNVLFDWGHPTAHNHNRYFTVGADANIISNSPSGGTSTSGVIPGINGGVGMRSPWGSAATRLEAFVGYKFSNTSLGAASRFQVGVRAGISLWH